MDTCTICHCDFDIDEEGGMYGEFGIIPVVFCPTCMACLHDMAQQLWGDDDAES